MNHAKNYLLECNITGGTRSAPGLHGFKVVYKIFGKKQYKLEGYICNDV